MLKQCYNTLLMPNNEDKRLLQFVKKFAKADACILDVGCGYGRFLKPLQQMGYQVMGVEANSHLVQANQQQGLSCIDIEQAKQLQSEFDLIILSHIIEHFEPKNLLDFLNFYLSKLTLGGHVIIATPLYSDYFYDDFDHVRPYQPLGLQMVFGQDKAQVQYYSPHRLVLRDLWFRRDPWLTTFTKAKYIQSVGTRLLQVIDLLSALLFKLSNGILGRKTGWVGVFQKESKA